MSLMTSTHQDAACAWPARARYHYDVKMSTMDSCAVKGEAPNSDKADPQMRSATPSSWNCATPTRQVPREAVWRGEG